MHLQDSGIASAVEIYDVLRRYGVVSSWWADHQLQLARAITGVALDSLDDETLHVEADRLQACGDPRGEVISLALGLWIRGDMRGTAGAVRWLEWICAARDLRHARETAARDAVRTRYGYPQCATHVDDVRVVFQALLSTPEIRQAWLSHTPRVATAPTCIYEAFARAGGARIELTAAAANALGGGVVVEVDDVVVRSFHTTVTQTFSCDIVLNPNVVSRVRIIAGTP